MNEVDWDVVRRILYCCWDEIQQRCWEESSALQGAELSRIDVTYTVPVMEEIINACVVLHLKMANGSEIHGVYEQAPQRLTRYLRGKKPIFRNHARYVFHNVACHRPTAHELAEATRIVEAL